LPASFGGKSSGVILPGESMGKYGDYQVEVFVFKIVMQKVGIKNLRRNNHETR